MSAHRSPKTFQVSAQTTRLLAELGATLDLSSADVLARAVAEMADRAGLVVAAEGEPPPHRHRQPMRRTIADPPGPIGHR